MSEAPPKKTFSSQYKKIIFFTIAVLIIALALFLWWFIWARFTDSTDDAYVHGNQVRLTPQICGIVVSVHTDNTELVEEGQVLVRLDETDKKIAFEESKAELGETIRKVSQMFENVYQLKAQYEMVQIQLCDLEIKYIDRKQVVGTGAISDEEFIQSESHYLSAKAAVESAKYQLLQAISLVQNTRVSNHPLVEKAKEGVRQAWVNLQRCTLLAPATGIVAQRGVQVGQSVNPNMPLLAIVPLDQMWVEANFKEVDLAKIRIGQPVHMTADTYGGSVVYRGEVIGIDGGSGAVFSPLPPQNATGNWIKIVQRIPVRINLNQEQLRSYPLRLGLSMHVSIDVSGERGSRIPTLSSDKPLYSTNVFQKQIEGVGAIIEEVMRNNISFDKELEPEILLLMRT